MIWFSWLTAPVTMPIQIFSTVSKNLMVSQITILCFREVVNDHPKYYNGISE